MAKYSWGPPGSQQTLDCVELILSGCLSGSTVLGAGTVLLSGSETIELRAPANKTLAMNIGTLDNTYVTINDHPAVNTWVFWKDVLVNDDTKLSFGAAGEGDSYIEYISATETLMISASATSIDGNMIIGTSCAQSLYLSSSLTASCDTLIKDFKKIYFGDSHDSYIGYNGYFLEISGAVPGGIALSGAIYTPHLQSGYAPTGSYIGVAADGKLVLTSSGGGGGGGSPGGSANSVQVNDGGGGFGGDSYLTYDTSAGFMKLTGTFNHSGTLNMTTGFDPGSGILGVVASLDPDNGYYNFRADYAEASKFVVSGTTYLTASAAGGYSQGSVLFVEGGQQTQAQGKPILYAQASGGLGYVGISTNSPKTELDINWQSANDPNTFAGGEPNIGGGERVSFATGSTSKGALYYLNESGGWSIAHADATGSGHDQMLGLALGTNASSDGMLIRGWFNASTYYQGGFRAGKAVYIHSGTAGYMSGAAPTGDNSYSRIVGYGSPNGNLIYFNPGSNWIELTESA